jgi:hypothetical protein
VNLQRDTPEKLLINGKIIDFNLKIGKQNNKTNFEKLCEELSKKNENIFNEGFMENYLNELRRRKMNSKIEKEQVL